MVLQNVYRRDREKAIVTFDFTDIEDGTGTIIYYPFLASDDASINRMTKEIHFTESKGTGGTSDAGVEEELDVTFETSTFNLPKTVRGTAYFRLPWTFEPSVGDQILSGNWIVTLLKWDGTTATSIATVTTRSYLSPAAGNTIPLNEVSMVELIVPRTNIKQGEALRVQLQLNVGRTVGTDQNSAWCIGHDPKDTSFSFVSGGQTLTLDDPQMAFYIPFDLDL